MKKIIITIFLIPILLGATIIVPFFINPILNNITLKKYSMNLFTYPAPPQTVEISRDSSVGLQVANGNHCDFRAEILFETTLSKDEITKYYNNVRMPSAKGNSKINIEINFKEIRDNKKLLYSIQILDDGYDAGFDIRCN